MSKPLPKLMGIVNVSPDSFSGGTSHMSDILSHIEQHCLAGADIVDIGAESTRPGAQPISEEEEIRRLMPLLESIAELSFPVQFSVDTRRARIARLALERGFGIINDVSAFSDPNMAYTIREYNATIILMHHRGIPTPHIAPQYSDIMAEIFTFLEKAKTEALLAGITADRIWLDPGIGFAKTTADNLYITQNLAELVKLGCPIVYGASRKRFLGDITQRAVHDRERATAAVCLAAILHGANVLRVHDIPSIIDAVRIGHALSEYNNPSEK